MYNIYSIMFILGLLLSKVALLMYIPTLYAFFTGSGGFGEFLQVLVLIHIIAITLLTVGKKRQFSLHIRDMFMTTTLTWVVAACFGALPFILIEHMSFTDSFFETMSGLTTTGSSVLTDLDRLPPSLLLWRSMLQWIGGIGFIVMAVAILPFLDVGGMRLFHTESSDWSDKSSPRMQDVAKNVMLVYATLTTLCFLGYHYAGMSNFDAVCHSFSTMATGGFSTSNLSMANYSTLAQWNTTLFMYLGSLPLLLFIQSMKKRTLATLYRDQQIIGYTVFVLVVGTMVTIWLWYKGIFNFNDSLRITFFNLINILSTTGYSLGNFDSWTSLTTILFAFLIIFGGCSGSTSGGIKMFRFQICLSMFIIQIKKLLHPNGIFYRSYNKKPITYEVIRSVIAFIMAFLCTILLLAFVLAMCGVDALSSLTGAATAVANVGPGLGPQIGPSGSFAGLPIVAKWALSVGMLLGRLEVMTVLVLLFPTFWKK